MIKKNSKIQEFNNFTDLALEWWNPKGKFKILHQILPIRMKYILKNIDKNNLKNMKVLDLGCGGGLTCEPLARLGAEVTGIDFVKQNIIVAKNHSINSNLKIEYINDDLDKLNLKKKYDLILLLEVIEHLDDWELLIKKIKKNLKPKGKLIISTINQTYLSKIFAIKIAENFLRWVPKHTHSYSKLIKPKTLRHALEENNLFCLDIMGMNFNPILQKWNLDKNFYPINYFCTALNKSN